MVGQEEDKGDSGTHRVWMRKSRSIRLVVDIIKEGYRRVVDSNRKGY